MRAVGAYIVPNVRACHHPDILYVACAHGYLLEKTSLQFRIEGESQSVRFLLEASYLNKV